MKVAPGLYCEEMVTGKLLRMCLIQIRYFFLLSILIYSRTGLTWNPQTQMIGMFGWGRAAVSF